MSRKLVFVIVIVMLALQIISPTSAQSATLPFGPGLYWKVYPVNNLADCPSTIDDYLAANPDRQIVPPPGVVIDCMYFSPDTGATSYPGYPMADIVYGAFIPVFMH